MSPSKNFRVGWENENLARYILSRFCFLSQPITISDDLGSDFICTFFKNEKTAKDEFFAPRSSFAIQIKSNEDSFEFKNIKYLSNLEIPFFVGVINQQKLKIIIYSNQSLPRFFSYVGEVKKIEIELVEKVQRENTGQIKDYFSPPEGRKNDYKLFFEKEIEISANEERELIIDKAEFLYKLCNHIQQNIASRINKEFIFTDYKHAGMVDILAGKDSAATYQDNFLKRLAESFRNLEYLFDDFKEKGDKAEIDNIINAFNFYEEIYQKYSTSHTEAPNYLIDAYAWLKTKMKNPDVVPKGSIANFNPQFSSIGTLMDSSVGNREKPR